MTTQTQTPEIIFTEEVSQRWLDDKALDISFDYTFVTEEADQTQEGVIITTYNDELTDFNTYVYTDTRTQTIIAIIDNGEGTKYQMATKVQNWQDADSYLTEAQNEKVEDCDHDETSGNWNYFSAEGHVLTVTRTGLVIDWAPVI